MNSELYLTWHQQTSFICVITIMHTISQFHKMRGCWKPLATASSRRRKRAKQIRLIWLQTCNLMQKARTFHSHLVLQDSFSTCVSFARRGLLQMTRSLCAWRSSHRRHRITILIRKSHYLRHWTTRPSPHTFSINDSYICPNRTEAIKSHTSARRSL